MHSSFFLSLILSLILSLCSQGRMSKFRFVTISKVITNQLTKWLWRTLPALSSSLRARKRTQQVPHWTQTPMWQEETSCTHEENKCFHAEHREHQNLIRWISNNQVQQEWHLKKLLNKYNKTVKCTGQYSGRKSSFSPPRSGLCQGRRAFIIVPWQHKRFACFVIVKW